MYMPVHISVEMYMNGKYFIWIAIAKHNINIIYNTLRAQYI